MRDRMALWVYLAIKQGGLRKRVLMGFWQLQQWAVVPPTVLIRLLNRTLIPKLYSRGELVWSAKMFDEQLKDARL
ncbi:hypothetical protein LCGC14_3113370 [marine sediment metagenome]|uniref:Uncharacterized protein n=1 Tax=marine sediment metagenome TaxID=412755 RepID=A0A0F8WTE7_9ZZZZ